MVYSRIVGTGSYLPRDTLTNFDLEKMVDTTDDWIVSRTGIRVRRIATEEEPLNVMGFQALARANANAGISWGDYDVLLTCCNTNKADADDYPRVDYFCPVSGSIHALLRQALGIEEDSRFNIPFFDVSAVGDAAVEIAEALMADGKYRAIGVVHVNALRNEARAEIYTDGVVIGRSSFSVGHGRTPVSHGREARHEEMASMGCQALLRAGRQANHDLGNLDLIIVHKQIDYIPPVSNLIAERLSSEGALSKPLLHCDIVGGCTSFLVGLDVADSFIRTGRARRVAVLAPEKFVGSCNGRKFTAIVDGTDRATCVIFGDGAGAFIMEASPEPGVLCTHFQGNGNKRGLLKTNEKGYVEMEGRELFKYVTPRVADSMEIVSRRAGFGVKDVRTYVLHQANYRIIEAVSRRLTLPLEKFLVNIDRVGNTSAATIPLVTDEYAHTLQRGETVLFSSFGAGVIWGSILMRY